MSNTILFIIAIVLTESITEIVAKSAIFEPLRKLFFEKRKNVVFKFIHDILDCPYCLSVWVGTLVGIVLLDIKIVNVWLDWFIIGLLLHKCSNVLHNLIDRTRRSI